MQTTSPIAADPIAIVTEGWDDLTGAIIRTDRNALKRVNMSAPNRIALLRQVAAQAKDPAHQAIINRAFIPMLQKQQGIAAAAASAAAARRVKESADLIDTATHIIPVNVDALANASTVTGDLEAPYDGQPWRYLDLFAASTATVGTRLTSFKLASVDHIVTSNVTLSTTPSDAGIDLAQLVGSNQQSAMRPRMQWRPWGLKRSGVLRPDAKIRVALSNRSGSSASMYLGVMVQASPCGEDSQYAYERGGVYQRRAKQSRDFFKKLLNFSLYS